VLLLGIAGLTASGRRLTWGIYMLLDLNAPPLGGGYLRAFDIKPSDPVLYRQQCSTGEFSIKLARDDDDRAAAEEIINRLYGWRGYGENHQLAEQATCTTFIACRDDEVIGTLTLKVDSAKRLGVDGTFPDELGELRAKANTSLCEMTKFAFDPSPASQPTLAALFHVIFIYGTQLYDCTDLLIEVNPRHVRFYRTMLGFEKVGSLRTNEAVNAPSQLLRLGIPDIERNIDQFAGRGASARHSLYPYFLAKDEERALRQRIAYSAEQDKSRLSWASRQDRRRSSVSAWLNRRDLASTPSKARAVA
jgi:hypothetical protein